MSQPTDSRYEEWRLRWNPSAGTPQGGTGEPVAHQPAPAPDQPPAPAQPPATQPVSAQPVAENHPVNVPGQPTATGPTAQPTATGPTAQPAATPPDPAQGQDRPAVQGHDPMRETAPISGTPYPTAATPVPGWPPPSPEQQQPARSPRGPGWLGVIGVAAAAALAASALTATAFVVLDDDTPASTVSRAPDRNVQAPVTSSSNAAPDWKAVATAIEPSVVSVQLQSGGQGSGVILDKEGRIITNYHVVAEDGRLGVILNDGRGYAAKVVGTDPQTDLAVIQMEDAPDDLKPAVFGDSSAVEVGDPVMVAGNPLGLAGTMTTGIVSAVDRPVTTQQQERNQGQDQFDPFGLFGPQQSTSEPVVTNAIQTDAAINPGNSGGALVDAQGRVIGINSSIATLGSSFGGQSGSIGLGFAIPANEVKNVTGQLVKDGKAQHPWLGVQLTDTSVEVDGARRLAAGVAKVVDDSPADKAGLRKDDAVIAVDGEAVNGTQSLVAQLRERLPDQSVALSVVRDGKARDITVTLGSQPQQQN